MWSTVRPARLIGSDRILVLDTAKGGVASAWMLYEMKSRRMAPLAIVFNSVNTILVQGAAHAGIPMLAGFDTELTREIPEAMKPRRIEISGAAKKPTQIEGSSKAA